MCKVTILCGDGPHHLYLAAEVLNAFGAVTVIVEPGRMQTARHLKRRAYRAWLWSTYHDLRRKAFGYDTYRRRYFARRQEPRSWEALERMPAVRVMRTPWINDAGVVDELRRARADVYIVMGTKKIDAAVLAEIPADRIVNIHGGYLPDYKGNHCFFFALKNGELDKLGTTVHRVTSGLDTGEIVMRFPVRYKNDDNSETLYSRAEKQAVDGLIARLQRNPDPSTWESLPQTTTGTVYRMRDRGPLTELVYRLALRKRRHGPAKKTNAT